MCLESHLAGIVLLLFVAIVLLPILGGVLPAQLMDYLSASMPFLIGVPDPLMKRIRLAELGDAVILNADNNKVATPFDDLDSIPT